ncbi:lipoprotein [Mycoplasmopsis canis UFG1]|uniref:Ig-specific serine endopeptidase MIP n=1 Tax=Mycoplasmopsis canis TaxID=29555 RepID=UPI00025B07FD|nr:DUF31 family protein [Mycoplasmopsis canis]EIE41213.1 lipoprotein [Mycoplasmopsis canis UFG1]
MNSKKMKKILSGLLMTSSFLGFSTVISCGDNKNNTNNASNTENKPNDPTPGSQNPGLSDPNAIPKAELEKKTFDDLFRFTNEYGAPLDYKSQSIQQFFKNIDEGKINISKIDEKTPLTFLNAQQEGNSAKLFFIYNNKENEIVTYTISGFEGVNYDLSGPKVSASKFGTYVKSSLVDRYKQDAEEYDQGLNRNSEPRKNLNATEKTILEFNKKAEELGLPNYDRANKMGMTIPKYDSSGNIIGLDLKLSETGKGPSWVDNYGKDGPKNRGLARTITNQTYANIALQTFQFNITNWNVSPNEETRKLVKEALKNDENVSLFINMLDDQKEKERLLGVYERNKTVMGVVKNVIKQTWEQMKKDKGGEEQAAVFYTNYIKDQRKKVSNRVNSLSIDQKIKDRLNKRIEDTTDFYNLEIFWDTKSGADGTAWIMDYEIPTNGSYPMKWYFATNLHVLDGFDSDNIESFGLTRLNKSTPSLFNKLKTNEFDRGKFTHYGIETPSALTRIFDGRDYLTKDPVEFLADKSFDKKEFIDIAIFEIDFTKTKYTKEQVQDITNDYANLPDNKKAQFANYDYLSNYEKIDIPLATKNVKDLEKYDSLYILGFPKTQAGPFLDYFLDRYEDEDLLKNARWSFSLWTNASYDLYNKPAPTDENTKFLADQGYGLSYNIGYRTFTNKPGITDQFLSFPVTGKAPYHSTDDNKDYISMNLAYLPKRYVPGGGASGSSVRTKDNKIVAIFHTANEIANTGVAAALRSNGFDYKGLYGTYNLPQYDIIYGTGKDQKNSYRHEMLNKNKGNTWLFKNGFQSENVPTEFKFTEKQS